MSNEECSDFVRLFCFLGFKWFEELKSRMDRLFIKGTDIRRDSTKNLYFCQTETDYVVRNTLVISKKGTKDTDSENI